MKNFFLISLLILSCLSCQSNTQHSNQNIITSDIDNFWSAYNTLKAKTDASQLNEGVEDNSIIVELKVELARKY